MIVGYVLAITDFLKECPSTTMHECIKKIKCIFVGLYLCNLQYTISTYFNTCFLPCILFKTLFSLTYVYR